MPLADAVARVGQTTAVAAGAATVIVAQAAPATSTGTNFRVAGLLVAISGLAAAVGTQVHQGLKLRYENEREQRKFLAEQEERRLAVEREMMKVKADQEERRLLAEQEDRRAKWERHDLANQVQAGLTKVEYMEEVITTLRAALELQSGAIERNREAIQHTADVVADSGVFHPHEDDAPPPGARP